jgi:hypothetical protein
VNVTIKNDNENSVEYYPLDELSCVTFEVTRQGEKVEETAWGRARMDASSVQTKVAKLALLKKGEELSVSINFTRFFDLSLPGKYEIKAKWNGKLEKADKPLSLQTPALACVVEVKPETAK